MEINVEAKGAGCDIVNISRVEELIQSKCLFDKVYTLNEQGYMKSKNAQTAAGLWAANEAVGKAAETGFTGLVMRDIEVLHNDSGKPEILLRNGAIVAAEKLKISGVTSVFRIKINKQSPLQLQINT